MKDYIFTIVATVTQTVSFKAEDLKTAKIISKNYFKSKGLEPSNNMEIETTAYEEASRINEQESHLADITLDENTSKLYSQRISGSDC